MAEITQRDVHHDQWLTNISVAYRNGMYIADTICPIVPVQKRSDLIMTYEQSHWFRNSAVLRAPATRSRRGGFNIGPNLTYYCHRYSMGFELPDEVRDNADAAFNLERDATEFVTDKMQMSREISFANNFFTTGVWGTDVIGGTGFTAWSDYGASTPLVNMTDYMDTVESAIAYEPNTIVMGKQVWNKLKWHPDLIDNIKYTQRGQMTVDLMASMMEIDRVLIGRSIVTTSPEGTAEASVTYSRIWGKHLMLMYVPPRPSLMTPAACYTLTWARVPNSIQYIVRHREEDREVDVIEANSYYAQIKTASQAGVFLSGVVA